MMRSRIDDDAGVSYDWWLLSCEMRPILEWQTRLHFAQTCRPLIATQADLDFCVALRSLRFTVLSSLMYSLFHCKHHATMCALKQTLSTHQDKSYIPWDLYLRVSLYLNLGFPTSHFPFPSWPKKSALDIPWSSILARWSAQRSCALIIWLSTLGSVTPM